MNMGNIFNWSNSSRAEGGLIFRKARRPRDRIQSLDFTFCISSFSQEEAGPCSQGVPEIA